MKRYLSRIQIIKRAGIAALAKDDPSDDQMKLWTGFATEAQKQHFYRLRLMIRREQKKETTK